MKHNQRKCVQFFEKFQYFINSFIFVFVINLKSVSAFSSVFIVVDKINIININTYFVKKLSFNEKNDFKIVILNHISNIEIVILFVVAIQVSKKNNEKNNNKIIKKILNK